MTCEELFQGIEQQKLNQNDVTYEVRNFTFNSVNIVSVVHSYVIIYWCLVSTV